VATLVVLQSVVRNVEVPILALLNVVTPSAKVQSEAVRIAVTQSAVTLAAVPNVAVLIVVTLSLVPVAAQSAGIQFWFQVVIRVALIAVLISVPYAARPVVSRASRVHDVPYQAFRVAAP